MTDQPDAYQPSNRLRFVTATSLFDGHDAAINLMRRILQTSGCEVIHLGHDRGAEEVVDAAIEEDCHGIAVSSYQGGHIEYFKYMHDLLAEKGAPHIRIFGGGGGVIVPEEIEELHEYGIARIYSPEDGRLMGLQGMIDDMMQRADFDPVAVETAGEGLLPLTETDGEWAITGDIDGRKPIVLARVLTLVERMDELPESLQRALGERIAAASADSAVPVIGFTGTGGSGKSSLVDEIVHRFLRDQPERTLAIVSIDPSKWKGGGALLGDRIRMNAISSERVYMRSLATRDAQGSLSDATANVVGALQATGFDLVLVETSGIGQSDRGIVHVSDRSVYVMTQDFGAHTQLEKINMIDVADLVVLNKFDRRGSADALKAVRKQVRRSRMLFDPSTADEDLPVFGTIASRFNDDGVNAFYHALRDMLTEQTGRAWATALEMPGSKVSSDRGAIIPPERVRYLAEIALTCRDYRRRAARQAEAVRQRWHLQQTLEQVDGDDTRAALQARLDHWQTQLDAQTERLLDDWTALVQSYDGDQYTYQVRGRDIAVPLANESLSGSRIPTVALPRFTDPGEGVRWRMLENLPGHFPYTAGIYPFKRTQEDPKRQFAGEGPPEQTNTRFHYLVAGDEAVRLSTAFDSATLYGNDPDPRPDIYGKIGESGVSICTLDDVKKLYAGFELCAPSTSVSMTINGPAPMMLAMFLNAAIDQQLDKIAAEQGRAPTAAEAAEVEAQVLRFVRGTVQADILKEDQAQNTCIFSTEFALKMMGDIQQFFIDHGVRNYYSVSISGYHIAEAGANPITQLALTLANGFTYVEYYLSRGMPIDAFAPNLSFFFSNGMEAEYSVIGRVARRIWSVAMRELYGGNARSQMLKYHIQTSGRSLHAQEMDFNDIRTTLQGLLAWYDNCNSLHTNAYDEAVTTPTEEAVRRAMAIQLIIGREFGVAKCENPNQGAYIFDELTDLVEEAVLAEFERISERGGVLGAMELQYQRSKIQDESLVYEHLKHNGAYPIIGVNTFLNPKAEAGESLVREVALTRCSPEGKQAQIDNLCAFQERNADACERALARLQQVVLEDGNIFAEMMNTARVASLGQIGRALYEVGGKYRRSM